jgi:hypothetical protein
LNKNREQAELFKGKTHKDIEITNKLSGDAEQGKQDFGRISSTVSGSNFNFYQQNPQHRTNFEVIQDVKNKPQN